MAQLSEVRSAIAEAHRDLDRVRAKLGLRTVMTPYNKEGDDNDQTAHLDRVADMIATRRAG